MRPPWRMCATSCGPCSVRLMALVSRSHLWRDQHDRTDCLLCMAVHSQTVPCLQQICQAGCSAQQDRAC